jgi:N-acetylglucosaminyldiphosphoundecaprenol N-acetyl-beta-D-mannosaminyltransferase
MEKQSIIQFPISLGGYKTFLKEIIHLAELKKSAYICVANVHMFIEAYKSPDFHKIVGNADIVTPDGRPLIWGLKILQGIEQERVAGMDLLPDLLGEMAIENISAFFFGSTEATLENTKTYIENNYPKLRIAGFHNPPFGQDHNLEEKEIVTKINDSLPCIVFVVLGCPKQEKWMASMKDKIQTVMIGIGGALPVMLGIQKRAPHWMQNAGLEWLYRLSQEPRRLFKRYVSTNSLFLWILIKEVVKIKILKPIGLVKF